MARHLLIKIIGYQEPLAKVINLRYFLRLISVFFSQNYDVFKKKKEIRLTLLTQYHG